VTIPRVPDNVTMNRRSRIARHALNTLAVFSLLLAVAIVALWVRSCSVMDAFVCDDVTATDARSTILASMRAQTGITFRHISGNFDGTHRQYAFESAKLAPHTRPFAWPPMSYASVTLNSSGNAEATRIAIADWLLLLLTFPLPIVAVMRFLRHRR